MYTAFHFIVQPMRPGIEILIAQLGELGFESFVENENGLSAYICSNEIFPDMLGDVQILNSPEFEITYSTEEIAMVNWNEEWEKNFQPIDVKEICHIRAPFHPKPKTEFDIVIEPKMSFGTGHHATTYMMVDYILREKWTRKKVLDMGCGTGILAILTEKKGAEKIDAIDIDQWCFENSLENVKRNNCTKISVHKSDATLLKGKTYDCILANINRNILLKDLPVYTNSLNEGGTLFLSGFYADDLKPIRNLCEKLGLRYESNLDREQWVAVKFVK